MSVRHAKSDTVADWTGTVTVYNSLGQTVLATATDLVRPTDWNSGHNQLYTLTGNTSLSSTASGTNVVYAASGPSISIVGSSDTIIWSSPAYGSYFKNFVDGAYQTTSISGSVSHAFPFNLPEPGSFSFIRMPVSMTSGASTSIATTTTTSQNISFQATSTWNAAVYSLGTGASSRSLQLVASGSCSWMARQSLSISSGAAGSGTVWSQTQALTYSVEGNTASVSTTTAVSQTRYDFPNALFTNFSGGRFLDIPFANSLTAGAYWLVFGMSSSSATNSTGMSVAGITNMVPRYSNHYNLTQINSNFGIMGSTNLTSGVMLAAGASFSTAGGGTTASIPVSALSSIASQPVFPIQFIRSA